MPLYEYRCPGCEKAFEVLATAKSSAEVQCPYCGSSTVERLIGLPGPGQVAESMPATNCRGDGPPCGAPWCGRKD
jgi:putative FmdB family regulatory protein